MNWTTVAAETVVRGYMSRRDLRDAAIALDARGLVLQPLTNGTRRVQPACDPFAEFAAVAS
jgi:hypothetical protein